MATFKHAEGLVKMQYPRELMNNNRYIYYTRSHYKFEPEDKLAFKTKIVTYYRSFRGINGGFFMEIIIIIFHTTLF